MLQPETKVAERSVFLKQGSKTDEFKYMYCSSEGTVKQGADSWLGGRGGTGVDNWGCQSMLPCSYAMSKRQSSVADNSRSTGVREISLESNVVHRVRIDGGVGGLNPPSSGLDSPSSGLDPPRFICFVMYFVHKFGSTPLVPR